MTVSERLLLCNGVIVSFALTKSEIDLWTLDIIEMVKEFPKVWELTVRHYILAATLCILVRSINCRRAVFSVILGEFAFTLCKVADVYFLLTMNCCYLVEAPNASTCGKMH